MNSDQAKKKYVQVAEEVLKEIQKGTWKEGEAIPTVRKLAEMFQVSPQTANKATSHLVGLGVLSSRQGSGSVVTANRAGNGSNTIAMLIDKARSSYVRGINDAVSYHGKELYLSYIHLLEELGYTPKLLIYDKSDYEIPMDKRKQLENTSGLLVQGTLPDCYIKYINEINLPSVLLNRRAETTVEGRFGSIVFDQSGLEQLSAYIASLGHKKVLYAFSNEFEITTVYTNRLEGFSKGFTPIVRQKDPEVLEFSFQAGEIDEAHRLKSLIEEEGYSAIICYNDITALRIYDLLHQARIRIPDQVSVCGYDDLFMAAMAVPPLTTVKIDRRKFIDQAIELLLKLQKQEEPSYLETEYHTELIIRRSCWQAK